MEKMKKMAEEMRSTTEKVKEDPIKKARNENFGADETMISHDLASISNKKKEEGQEYQTIEKCHGTNSRQGY